MKSTKFTLRNILFATDLSPSAEKALPYAVGLARQFGATVHVVHALHPEVYPFTLPDTWPLLTDAEERVREEGSKKLEAALRGISHELIFEVGPIWKILSRNILKYNIDLIVLGTHGRSGVEKALLGSVAEEVFRQASCPVLTVGPYVRPRVRSNLVLNRILYPTDFSSESLAAAPYAVSLAKESSAHLTLLHCTHNSEEFGPTFHALRDVVPLGANLLYPSNCVVKHGPPGQEILRVSDEENTDLIILGVRSAKWGLTAATHFTSSTAYKIVTEAACPVLTVRD